MTTNRSRGRRPGQGGRGGDTCAHQRLQSSILKLASRKVERNQATWSSSSLEHHRAGRILPFQRAPCSSGGQRGIGPPPSPSQLSISFCRSFGVPSLAWTFVENERMKCRIPDCQRTGFIRVGKSHLMRNDHQILSIASSNLQKS